MGATEPDVVIKITKIAKEIISCESRRRDA